MTKLEEYFKNKRIKELGLPKIYIVKSDREGVYEPIENQVVDIKNGVSIDCSTKLKKNRYLIENKPYEIDIEENKNSCLIEGYGTGFCDLLEWSYYCSFSKDDAYNYYINQKKL
jgi:hypothetical protein